MIFKRKGFTLIELLAVIIILGVLILIAVPSVSNYIVESRKKSLIVTIENYINSFSTDVNNLEYIFDQENAIYAVPIDCISLERGGADPFGEWHQANKTYFAYVLVQYNYDKLSYVYGYTFKDSSGLGIYPTRYDLLDKDGTQIRSGLDLTKPSSGSAQNLTSISNWNGFAVDENTEIIVLDAETEGTEGDGNKTCTLRQKGDNYEEVENDKKNKLSNIVKKNNTIIKEKPTLNKASHKTEDESGLYVSNSTNNGKDTYYFRGNVLNNNVDFAGFKWKIIRINENGTVRLILNDKINNNNFQFNSLSNDYMYMYYSNSLVKEVVENWYKEHLSEYDSYISTDMFCEQAKVKYYNWTGGNAEMTLSVNYTPNFKCGKDGNGKGIINSKVGLISYDEVVHAGGYYGSSNSEFFLYTDKYDIWTMSPTGINSTGAGVWFVKAGGTVYDTYVTKSRGLSPVINLSSDVVATGIGTDKNPYVITIN